MNNFIMEIKNISKIYGKKEKKVVALDDVSIQFMKKGFVFINGISGSGKTTLMNILAGLDSPTKGEIIYQCKNISNLREREWDDYRNSEVGVVFQNFNLIDEMTIRDNLLIPLKIQDITEKECNKLIQKTLEYVGLEDYMDRQCVELSAGQKQRVAIARAIIKKPKILLADEATGNLDPENTELILKLFDKISKECLVVLISHSESSAEKFADRIITLSEGKVVEDKDNTRIKNLYHYPYQIDVLHGDSNKAMQLNNFSFKRFLAENSNWNGHNFDQIEFRFLISPQNKEIETFQENWKKKKTTIKHLPFKDIWENSIKNIGKKRFKTGINILLIAFICVLFLISFFVTKNDYIMSISNYLSKTEYSFIKVYQDKSMENDEELDVTIYKGKDLFKILDEQVGNENILKCINNCEIIIDNSKCESVDLYFSDDYTNISDEGLQGKWPDGDNQITINKEFAEKLNIKVGDFVSILDTLCQVVGLCDLKVVENNNLAIISPNVLEQEIYGLKCCSLQGIDITLVADKSSYAYGINTIGKAANLSGSNSLIWGELPQENNQIVISSELASEIGYYNNRSIVTNYRIPDLYAEKYNDTYGNIINLYDFVGNNVEIVGIYDCEQLDEDIGNIILKDNVYQSILETYVAYFNFDSYSILLDYENEQLIRELDKKEIKVQDDICSHMYMLKEITEKMKKTSCIIIIILIVMIIFLMILFMTYNVKDQAKKIGIMRAIGVGSKEIGSIYLIENMLICICAIVLGEAVAIGVVHLVNYKIQKILELGEFQMFTLNYGFSILLGCLVLLLGIIATIIPLRKLSEEKSINLLK